MNERIRTLFQDHCTIRRMLIEEGYMTRDGQTYRLGPTAAAAPEPLPGASQSNAETPPVATTQRARAA